MTDSEKGEISLTQVDSQRRASDERTRDGKSGSILYQIEYHDESSTIVRGKSAEVDRVENSDRMELEALEENKYTHYAIFRLEDRSTTTIVQDVSGDLYKILSLGRNTTKISHPVTITETDG